MVWVLLRSLPRTLRERIVRSLLPVPSVDSPPDIVFKRADTYAEIEAALRLVYESYQERKLVPHSEHKLRLTKYHALPTTAVLIAKKGDEVIATLSLILDSALGLPIEELWNISHLRERHTRIAEVSSLAIKRGYRGGKGELLFPLCKYMYLLSKDHLGVDALVAAVHPMVRDFYECILRFKEIDNRVHRYSFAEGAKAVGLYLSIDGTAEEEWRKTYHHLPPHRDYYRHFVLQRDPPAFQFASDAAGHVGQYVLSPGLLEYLFTHCSEILSQMTPQERLALSNVYYLSEYQSVIGLQDQSMLHKRAHPRFAMMMHASMKSDSLTKVLSVSVVEASRFGIKMRIPGLKSLDIASGQNVSVSIELSPSQVVSLKGMIKWISPSGTSLGIDFQGEVPMDWITFIKYIENKLLSIASAQPLNSTSAKLTGT